MMDKPADTTPREMAYLVVVHLSSGLAEPATTWSEHVRSYNLVAVPNTTTDEIRRRYHLVWFGGLS